MANLYINRFACSALFVFFSWCGFAQQIKPVSAKTTKTNAAQCTKGGMACCKGTPTRATVLAANAAKPKPVKK